MTITSGVTIHFDRVQARLHALEEQLWACRQQLSRDTQCAVFLSPAPPVRQAVDAIQAAQDAVAVLRAAFRDAAGATPNQASTT